MKKTALRLSCALIFGFILFLLFGEYYTLSDGFINRSDTVKIYAGSFIDPDVHFPDESEISVVKEWAKTLKPVKHIGAIMGEGPNIAIASKNREAGIKLRYDDKAPDCDEVLVWSRGVFTAKSNDRELTEAVYKILLKYASAQ